MLHLMLLEYQVNRIHGERTQEAADERSLRAARLAPVTRLIVVRTADEAPVDGADGSGRISA